MRRAAAAIATCFATTAAAFAHAEPAQPNGESRAEARELGEKGDAAFGAGRCDKAIDFWRKADATFHAPTLLLRIARCEALLGRVVAATATLERIAGDPLPANAPPAWSDARTQAATELPSVRGRIAKIDVRVKGAEGRALTIAIDDEPLPPGEHVARVDPGAHRVMVRVAETSAERRLTVGDGEERPVDLTVAVELPGPRSRAQRNAGLALGGVGLVALGVGIGFGVSALSISSRLDAACGDNHRNCAPSQQASIDKLGAHSLVADFALAGGALFAVAGGVVLLTDTSSKTLEPKVKVQLARATLLELGR